LEVNADGSLDELKTTGSSRVSEFLITSGQQDEVVYEEDEEE